MLNVYRQIVQLLSRIRNLRGNESANGIARLCHLTKHAGSPHLENLGEILKKDLKACVRLIASIPVHCILKTHARQRHRNGDAFQSENTRHHPFNHREQRFTRRKRRFNIDLRKFRLAVGSKIFIAKTLHDLEILFETGNHQDLLEQLGRLRQRVKTTVLETARHQVISRPFGRGFRQNRRFDFPESLRIHIFANGHRDAMPHAKRLLQLWPAKIKVPVLQAKVFGSCDLVFNGKRCRFGVVENPQFVCDDLDLTCFKIWILETFVAHADLSADCNHKFRSQRFGLAVQFSVVFGVEDDLSDAFAVAQIDKNELPVIAPAIDPAHHHDLLSLVSGGQFAARVSSLKFFH